MTTKNPFKQALVFVVLLPVMFYRRVLSPMKGAPSCRFLPTCSEYAIDAVKHRGVIIGSALAVWRVLRCNPFCKAGYDPVPGSHASSCRDGHHAQEHK